MENAVSDPQTLIAEVLLDDALKRPLDYEIPSSFRLQVVKGTRVLVPVRTTLREGTVVSIKGSSPFKKLLAIQKVLLENKPISDELMQLAEWMADYYCTPLRKVLKTALPPSVRGSAKAKEQQSIGLNLSVPETAALCQNLRRAHPQQALLLDVILQSPKGILLSELLEKARVSTSPLRTLVKQGVLLEKTTQIDRTLHLHAEYLQTRPKILNEEQQAALLSIQASLDANRFEVRLLHGVTGSGKTEVYLQAIDHALKQGKGVLFLVPEIALTSQVIEKLKGRFQQKIALLHSRLSPGERFDSWHQMREGKIQIVMGARSALFSPIKNLGLIIVDEEHESSYKQSDDSPTYNARDVAIVRGKFASASVVLGSATPSLESYYNVTRGKYTLSALTERADSARLPTIHIVDMKKERSLFSELLIAKLKERLEKGEQAILFLNRRGYHTTLLCTHCAQVSQCPRCSIPLTFHKGAEVLTCHLCHFETIPPRVCPSCSKEGVLKFKGVGTERVEKTLHALFPEARTLRLDADTTRHKGSHEALFKQFKAGKADILIGTQMIAKGLDFPSVTLVAIISADGSLQIPDFRAAETTFQLLTQVAGRSGRGERAGEVILQTYLPDHPLIHLATTHNYKAFFEQEIAVRELFQYPPFTHLVKFTFKGKEEGAVQSLAEAFRSDLIQALPPSCELLPVQPCGHAKINHQFRFQFLLKTERLFPLQTLLKQKGPLPCSIDVDPVSTFF
jgi:primosomal protein N' (replication factor Y)